MTEPNPMFVVLTFPDCRVSVFTIKEYLDLLDEESDQVIGFSTNVNISEAAPWIETKEQALWWAGVLDYADDIVLSLKGSLDDSLNYSMSLSMHDVSSDLRKHRALLKVGRDSPIAGHMILVDENGEYRYLPEDAELMPDEQKNWSVFWRSSDKQEVA